MWPQATGEMLNSDSFVWNIPCASFCVLWTDCTA